MSEPTSELEPLDAESAVEVIAPADSESAESADGPDAAADSAAEEPAGNELVEEGDIAADYLEGLLDIVDLDGDIDITVENDRAAVSVIEVETGDLAQLVGAEGEVLRSLQDLVRLAVARETGHRSRLMLDIAGHRATRRSELQRIAGQAIETVRNSGEPARLAPMSAFERKVVHDEAAAAGLASESEGAEPHRYVVITQA